MKKMSSGSMQIAKKIAVFVICLSLVMSTPDKAAFVNAMGEVTQEGTGESDTTEASQSTEEDKSSKTTQSTESTESNKDANGTLGKNSDIGISVTQSIKGQAGKPVSIEFVLVSSNPEVIKLKDVYPVIDTTFPFETSGDAYKVVSAGADLGLQAQLGASFAMTARSDLETGYHSIRFVGEYTKIAADGTAQDFYVIKTINIYFGEPATESSSSSKKSTNKNSTTESDDDDSSSYSSYNSYDSEVGESAAPKLVITGYDTTPEKIMAGEVFTLTIHIQNTSKTTNVCNGKFLIGNEAGTFLPTSGSSAVFVESIPAGETGDLEIEMKTSADLAQKNYMLVVKGDFDDGKGNAFTSSDNLSVPVYQEVKLGVTDVSMTPGAIGIGAEGSLMFTINNQGTAGVYNVNVSVKDDAVVAEESYVGNIAGSASAYASLNVIGQQDNSDSGTIKIQISYEDTEGNTGTIEQDIACLVGEGIEYQALDGFDESDDYEEYDEWPVWLIVLIILIVLVLIAGVVFFVLKKRKKNADAQADDDDDDFDYDLDDEVGEDDIDNENI